MGSPANDRIHRKYTEILREGNRIQRLTDGQGIITCKEMKNVDRILHRLMDKLSWIYTH